MIHWSHGYLGPLGLPSQMATNLVASYNTSISSTALGQKSKLQVWTGWFLLVALRKKGSPAPVLGPGDPRNPWWSWAMITLISASTIS